MEEEKITIKFGKQLRDLMKKKNINNFQKANIIKMHIDIKEGYDSLNDLLVLCLDVGTTLPEDIADLINHYDPKIRQISILEVCAGMISE